MYCRDCGTQNPDNAKFCANCGKSLQNEAISNPLSQSANQLIIPPPVINTIDPQKILEETIASYQQKGWVLISSTIRTAQLKKPKKFNWWWFLLWILVTAAGFGFGAIIYLIYYAVKKDQLMSLQFAETGDLLIDGIKTIPPQTPLRPPTPEEQAANPPIQKSNAWWIVLLVIALIIIILVIAFSGR